MSDDYLVEHIRQALAHDERANELDVRVEVTSSRIILTGTVATEERQAAVGTIVRELCPDHHVVNETSVMAYDEPHQAEHLA